jgi:iron complex outermembrane receptor protein
LVYDRWSQVKRLADNRVSEVRLNKLQNQTLMGELMQNLNTNKAESVRAKSRVVLGASASGLALALAFAAAPAFAQDAAPQSSVVEEVVVTGSRITAAGFTAPTPTTVVGVEAIEKSAQPNLFNQITQLPSLAGSTGSTVNNGNTSTGQTGLSSFGLRGLNPIRTLTLLDGQRVVPAFRTGIADVSMFPNLLVKQVDVVTGGASSSYGSDAVAGVVNFVTDTRFKGYKANVSVGESTYEDSRFANVQIAVGQNFLNDRLHVQASTEYYRNNGVPPGEVGVIQPNGRKWFQGNGTVQTTIANTPAGKPQITFGLNSQQYLYSKYGLITSGPLQGTAFGDNGSTYQFQYGSNGVPVRAPGNNASNAVTGCIAPLCFGGDRTGEVGVGTQVDSPVRRAVFYGRTGFELTDNIELYASVNLAQVKTNNQPNAGAVRAGNITVQCDNAFLPASVAAGCAANNITQFNFGTANANYPEYLRVNNDRQQHRFVLGAQGDFDLLGTNWDYDGYFQFGETVTKIDVTNITIPTRFLAAMDAVRDASGAIVCRSAAARAGGCIPWNAFGNNAPNLAAFRYFTPIRGPHNDTYGSQKVAAFSVNGEPFQGWAGPIAVAAGAEWREEYYKQRGDVYGNGLTPAEPLYDRSAAGPAVRRRRSRPQGNYWYAGNFHNGQGKYTVRRKPSLEVNVPLFDTDVGGQGELQRRRPPDRLLDLRLGDDLEGRRHLGHPARRPAPAGRALA